MIASSLLPLRSVFVLPSSAASRSRPATATLLPVPRISLSRRFAASATESSSEEEEAAARSTNGSLPPAPSGGGGGVLPGGLRDGVQDGRGVPAPPGAVQGHGPLVVVDFYRPSCGSCKYIEKGFIRLCKGSGDDGAPVVFLKHNVRPYTLRADAACTARQQAIAVQHRNATRVVIDEYDEQSEVADRLRIKIVPLFHFYKDGVLVESFATRDKERILAAIRKYTSAEQEPEEEEQQE
ncbi:unnamed protein product [Miscanthus lutarioriparius]|uniref:Thioredoxin domain-containing protein n=1 Tax=Miscanthus lutarioriparius TaxID=422564 RepID=A0A811PMK0_9POAL|nr:unnamed protein product [Miscanthus lutarioriparius]